MDLNELKLVLYNYVKKFNDLKKEKNVLEGNNSLLEEILRILDKCFSDDYDECLSLSLCLVSLFGNKYDNLLNYMFKCDKLKQFGQMDSDSYKNNKLNIINIIYEIRNEYLFSLSKLQSCDEKITDMKPKMIVARRIISCIKYNQFVSKNDIALLGYLLKDLNIDEGKIAVVVERLFLNNKFINTKETGKYYTVEEKYKFINLLSLGGEVFEYPLVENASILENYAESVLSLLEEFSDEIDKDDLLSVLPSVGKEIRTLEELEYILMVMLDSLYDELYQNINLMKDSDFLIDLNSKNRIANDCYKLIDNYKLIRDYLDNELYKEDDINLDDSESFIEEDKVVNNVFYLISPNGKCYFESDLEDIPYEYLEKTLELIDLFKKGILSKKKKNRLIDFAGDFSELKGDQIRIIYKRIKDNNYVIYGAFVKKEDNRSKNIMSLINRIGVVGKNSEQIEDQINDYVINNSRKWSR